MSSGPAHPKQPREPASDKPPFSFKEWWKSTLDIIDLLARDPREFVRIVVKECWNAKTAKTIFIVGTLMWGSFELGTYHFEKGEKGFVPYAVYTNEVCQLKSDVAAERKNTVREHRNTEDFRKRYIELLSPTNSTRSPEQIQEAIDLINRHRANSRLSTGRAESPEEQLEHKKEDSLLKASKERAVIIKGLGPCYAKWIDAINGFQQRLNEQAEHIGAAATKINMPTLEDIYDQRVEPARITLGSNVVWECSFYFVQKNPPVLTLECKGQKGSPIKVRMHSGSPWGKFTVGIQIQGLDAMDETCDMSDITNSIRLIDRALDYIIALLQKELKPSTK